MDENVLRLTSRGLIKEKDELTDNKSSTESSLDHSISTLHQAVNKVKSKKKNLNKYILWINTIDKKCYFIIELWSSFAFLIG